MFKFIRQYAEKMDSATIFPMISLVIFFTFFVVLLVYVKKMGQKERSSFLSCRWTMMRFLQLNLVNNDYEPL